MSLIQIFYDILGKMGSWAVEGLLVIYKLGSFPSLHADWPPTPHDTPPSFDLYSLPTTINSEAP